MTRPFAFMLALSAPLTMLAVPVQAAAVAEGHSHAPQVSLTVSESVFSAPDLATIGAGVLTRAATAQEAAQQNALAMEKVVERLHALGIASKDIQTSNFNLSPQYDYDQETREQRFRGYQASNQVTVNLHDLDRVGQVLDALVAAGANNINGPSFVLEDNVKAQIAAREKAFQRGKRIAQDYARMAGYSSVKLLEVSESYQSQSPRPYMALRAAASSGEAATPIEPGEVATEVTMSLKFAMTR